MKALLQRVTHASVIVNDQVVGHIGKGLCILLGIHRQDTSVDVDYLLTRILNVKLWPSKDGNAPWKQSILDLQGEILVVSQFTLYARTTQKGRAPDYHLSMKAPASKTLFDEFVERLKLAYDPSKVQTGVFQAYMNVNIINDGPVTIEIESEHYKKAPIGIKDSAPVKEEEEKKLQE